MPKYIAKTQIHHDGKPYAIGASLELTEAQAADLFALNAIEDAPEEADTASKGKKGKSEDKTEGAE